MPTTVAGGQKDNNDMYIKEKKRKKNTKKTFLLIPSIAMVGNNLKRAFIFEIVSLNYALKK